MIDIACDACGKRYRIDEAKMKAETAKVKCKTCGHVITRHPAAAGRRHRCPLWHSTFRPSRRPPPRNRRPGRR